MNISVSAALQVWHDTHPSVVRKEHKQAIKDLVAALGPREAARMLADEYPDMDTPSHQYLSRIANQPDAEP